MRQIVKNWVFSKNGQIPVVVVGTNPIFPSSVHLLTVTIFKGLSKKKHWMSFYLFCQVSKDLSAKYLFVEGNFFLKKMEHICTVL